MRNPGDRRGNGFAQFNRKLPVPGLLALLLLLPLSPRPIPAGAGEAFRLDLHPTLALEIGRKVWRNECGGRPEGLLAWNAGEEFPSLGIGHFIWYPEGTTGPFRESFPALLDHLAGEGVELPPWLAEARKVGCPWPDRRAFQTAAKSRRVAELRELLAATVGLQAEFLAKRLSRALPEMLEALDDPAARKRVEARFRRLAESQGGLYALVDYVNFKGEGIDPKERYAGEGWGLLQVLEGMTDAPDPCADFAASAGRVLTRRVANARRDESRWLKGWRKRVASYRPPSPRARDNR